MPNGAEVTLRPFAWGDLSTLVEIINHSDEIDGLERGTSEKELRAWWTSPGMEPESNAFLAAVDGDTVGYGLVRLRKGDERSGFSKFQCYGIVLPEWRGQGVGTRIFAECERRARRRLDQAPTLTVYLEAYADKRQHDVAELYVKFGLGPVRYFFEMIYDSPEMPAAPDYPVGYRSRTFVRGRDEKVTWRVMNIAFRDHWGHVDHPLEEWLHWVDGDYFSPDLVYLGLDPDGEVAGECVCSIYPEENERVGRDQGWADSLGGAAGASPERVGACPAAGGHAWIAATGLYPHFVGRGQRESHRCPRAVRVGRLPRVEDRRDLSQDAAGVTLHCRRCDAFLVPGLATVISIVTSDTICPAVRPSG